MAHYQAIKIADIIVPERLRMVEEDHALAIQASIVEHGLINPITVRRTPPATKPFRPYILVAGAHRLRAIELLDEAEIESVIVEADKLDAIMIEITENLFRNELSALDRAMFVMSYREAYEQKNGKVSRGRPANSVNLTELIAGEAAAGFSAHVANRLGLSVSAIERAQRIGQQLSPDLRQRLRGTPVADNQTMLLKLAAMEPQRQKLVALAFSEKPDIARAIDLTDPHAQDRAQATAQDKILSTLIDSWRRADDKTKAAFLEHAGAALKVRRERLPSVGEVLTEADVERAAS